MSKPTSEDYKIRFILYKKWQHKTNSKDAVKKINDKFGQETINESDVNECYQKFDNDNFEVFEKDIRLYVFSTQNKEKPKNLIDSLLLVTNNMWAKEIHVHNDRFLIIPHKSKEDKLLVTIYDIVKNKKRTIPILSKRYGLKFIMTGEYLLWHEYLTNPQQFHILKINWEDLSAEKLKTSITKIDYYLDKIIMDILDSQKFVIVGWNNATTGQFFRKNDGEVESVLGNKKTYENIYIYAKCLVGEKMRSFMYNRELSLLEFFEFDLNKMEKTTISVPVNLDTGDDELTGLSDFPGCSCWSKDCFYGIFQIGAYQNFTHRLLCFNFETLKWSDVGILAQSPINIFVDENDVMTLQVGNYREYLAFYRVALRKPDSLMNLTRLCAFREANIYGTNKYVNVARKIQI